MSDEYIAGLTSWIAESYTQRILQNPITPAQLAQHFEQSDNLLLRLVRQHRPYRIPKPYLRWEILSALVAASIAMRDDRSLDWATFLNANRTDIMVRSKCSFVLHFNGSAQGF